MARESFEQLMFYFGFKGRTRRPEQRELTLPPCAPTPPRKAPQKAKAGAKAKPPTPAVQAKAPAAKPERAKPAKKAAPRAKTVQAKAAPAKPERAKRAAGRTASRSRERLDVDAIAETVEQLEHDPLAVPQPIAPPGYRPTECTTEGPAWGAEYTEALADATERAAIEAGEDEDRFRVLLRQYFAEHPQFPAWSELEHHCVATFREKHSKRRRRTETSTSETKRALRDVARELGHEIRGSAEHLDRLTLGGQASHWRRVHKRSGSKSALQKARTLEARMRAGKKKGRGVATHRAG